jgi:PAS domain S-box-containing protein
MSADPLDDLRQRNTTLAQQVKHLLHTEQRLFRAQHNLEAQLSRIAALGRFTLHAAGVFEGHAVLAHAAATLVELWPFDQVVAYAARPAGTWLAVAAAGGRGLAVPDLGTWPEARRVGAFALPPVGPTRFAPDAPLPGWAAALGEVTDALLGAPPKPSMSLLLPIGNSERGLVAVLHARSLGGPVAPTEALPGGEDDAFLVLFASHVEGALDAASLRRRTRASELLLDAGFESSPVGMAIVGADTRFQRVNPALSRIVGFGPAELVGRSILELEDRGERGPADPGAPAIERRWRHASGRPLWVQVTSTQVEATPGGAEHFFIQVEDISARKGARAALERAEARLRSILEQLPDAVCVLRGGRIAYANPAAGRQFGDASAASLLDRPFAELVAAPERPAFLEDLAAAAAAPRGPRERTILRSGHPPGAAELSLVPVVIDDEAAILVAAKDRTDERRMREQLLQAERLASVGTLAAGVAHEINNPLTFVMLNLERLVGANVDDATTKLAAAALDGARRIREIMRDLKTFSRADAERKDRVDMRQMLATVVAMTASETRHSARVEFAATDEAQALGDENRLTQVFLNLVVNAAQAIEAGHAREHLIRLEAQRVGDEVVVTVRDTGRGVPADVLSRLFEPFFTTKAPGVGSGLGLSICKNIVEAHGGTISVAPALPRGTVFTVRLPAAPMQLPTRSPIAPPPPGAARRGRVLLVDDEPALRRSLADLLSDDHDVVTVAGARAAVELLGGDPAFDVILCDLMMPDMTGMELHEWLGAHAPMLLSRTIYMSGGTFTSRASEFRARISNRVLDKPFRPAELMEAIREAVGSSPSLA